MTAATDTAWKGVLGRVGNVGFHPLDTKALYEFVVIAWRDGDATGLDLDDLETQVLAAGGSDEWVTVLRLTLQFGLPVLDAQAELGR